MARGTFITFEGPECSGKSTQLRLLHERLRQEGCAVVVTKEPGGSLVGNHVRRILLSSDSVLTPVQELLLFYCDRNGNIEQVIKPALARGAVVLSDRFYDSTTAYQHYGRGLPLDLLERIHAVAVGGFAPDRTLLYDIGMDTLHSRVLARKSLDAVAAHESRFDDEMIAFHSRVREGYLEMARQKPGTFRVLDGNERIEVLHEKTYLLAKEAIEAQR